MSAFPRPMGEPVLMRRVAVALCALLAAGTLWLARPVEADTKAELDAARERMLELIAQIEQQSVLVSNLQGQAHNLALGLDELQSRLADTQARVVGIQQTLQDVRGTIAGRQEELDRRAWVTYVYGPGSQFAAVLGSTSLADLADRLQIADRMVTHDRAIIEELTRTKADLQRMELEVEALEDQQLSTQAEFEQQQRALSAKLAEEQVALDQLEAAKVEADALVFELGEKYRQELEEARQRAELAARIAAERAKGVGVPGTFNFCPVDQPHAYGDEFGAPRYVGGYHPHAGNDIMAPTGTPIRAPFDGVARDATNNLGGLAVIVTGASGWVYNAHLSAFGARGPIPAGTVIGYVGATGQASGGVPHNHFEWHPDVIPADLHVSPYGYSLIGDAIDPYPFLNAVC